MSEYENVCAVDGCRVWYPRFPDEDLEYYCRDHYPEPNGGEFTHVPVEDRREELREQYQ